MEEEVQRLRADLDRLTREFEITLGRANGLHMTMLVLTREWGKPAADVIENLERTIERGEATALPTPLPDATIAEAHRVARMALETLRHAHREGG
ncbi:hypothetical protein SNE32_14740 [Lysobacter sp. D1-1-M9]|uniref:hypothetical protein n=1 Tax=Novilysobacter longmucuonensis TaxID=3098603 RepID=UPI002FCA2B1E